MVTKYKHIEFELIQDRWYCYTKKGEDVGQVYYDDDWGYYVWKQTLHVRCSMSCLEDVIAFTKQL